MCDEKDWVLCKECDIKYRKELQDAYKKKERGDFETYKKTGRIPIATLKVSDCPMCEEKNKSKLMNILSSFSRSYNHR